MQDKYFLLKALSIGLAFFFFRYSFYLTNGPTGRKKYFGVLVLAVVCLGGYFSYLQSA
jgi:hypothetical protein